MEAESGLTDGLAIVDGRMLGLDTRMTTPPRPASVAILIVAPAIVLCAGALATLFAVASLIAVEAAGHGRLSAEIVGGMIAICGLPVR